MTFSLPDLSGKVLCFPIFSLKLLSFWEFEIHQSIITSFVSFSFHQISRFKMAISLEMELVSVEKYLLKGE